MSTADEIRARILDPAFLERARQLREATITQVGASALRQRILAEAGSWIGTPFHDGAGVRGGGCDCLHLIIRVFAAVGLLPAEFDPGPYSPQWMLHKDEPLYLIGVTAHARRIETPQPGDFALYHFGRQASHAGIIIDDTTLIHAYKPVGKVTIGDRRSPALVAHSYWTVLA